MNIYLTLLCFIDIVIAKTIDYNTVYEFSKMSHNVYYDIGSKSWLDTKLDVVKDISLNNDTVKAYSFTNDKTDEMVIAFKGTSIYWVSSVFDESCKLDELDELSTSMNDKFNDNLFFSCCFYKQSKLFEKCDKCISYFHEIDTKSCCKDCYKQSLDYPTNYINVVKEIIETVKLNIDFDNIPVYFTGHSLGGMLASIASSLYNKPAVTFEAPGDLRYMTLTNMKIPNDVYHFGHNGDPLFMGHCGSTCSVLGYYIDTKCHGGYTCLYDSKTRLGYSESILNHRIEYIINHIIPKWESDFPECFVDTNCTDCENWNLS